jgi:MOSC domain-containing protein YiiM
MGGVVEQIAITPIESALPERVESVEVLPDQGPRGDRYFVEAPDPERRGEGRDLTLIEAEALEAFAAETGLPLTHEESRRNVLTRDVRLNDLVGKRFRIGAVECVAVQLCEPCSHLQGLTREGVLRGMVHRAGLNANVVTAGTIATGDDVVELTAKA